MTLKNRLVMSATECRTAAVCVDTGTTSGVHEGLIHACAERAKGGVGLITLEDTDVDSRTGAIAGYETMSAAHPTLDRDLYIPAFRALTNAVHAFGAKVIPNLRHLGAIAIPQYGGDPLSASASPNPRVRSRYGHSSGPDARAAMPEEIQALQSRFVEAAFRAKRAGFDGVQLAGHHGFLISQFLSPRTNHRTDEYGGKLENRTRFAVELVEQVRLRIGAGMAIVFGISGDELVEGGLTLEESKVIAQALERAGVDAFHVVPGIIFPFPNGHRAMPTMGEPDAVFADIAGEIKRAVKVPVIANGRIKTPAVAARVITEGKADLVSMSRALIADPEWPVKVLRGEAEDITPCIGCNYCVDALQAKLVTRCTVNARWGREDVAATPAATPKRVLVIGGGPAGLEAARVAFLRGHHVTLIERDSRLGGQLWLAEVPPGKAEIRPFREYLVRQVEELGVTIELGTAVTVGLVRERSPDAVIVATGATPVEHNGQQKAAEMSILSAWSVLSGHTPPGGRVVVAGGGATGCEVADHLAAQGKAVTIVEMESEFARDMNPLGEGMRYFLLERLAKQGVAMLSGVKFVGVEGRQVLLEKDGGRMGPLEADAAVLSTGVRPCNDMNQTNLNRFVPTVRVVGDSSKPRTILDAVWEGAVAAESI